DARGFLLHRPVQGITLRVRIVRVRPQVVRANFELRHSSGETRSSRLPVRNLKVSRHEYIVFVGIVRGTATQQRSGEKRQRNKRNQFAEHRILLRSTKQVQRSTHSEVRTAKCVLRSASCEVQSAPGPMRTL